MASCNNLPEELIVEILSRLPVRSLHQFKSVSKPWLTLISSPSFVRTHLNHSATHSNKRSFIAHSFQPNNLPNHTISLLRLNSLENTINLEHPFPESFSPLDMEVVGSCNGLLCLTNSLGRICLWNPATRRVNDISNFAITVVDATGEISLGFGFDGIMNDYKVVRIVCTSRSMNSRCRVEVYSVNVGAWRETEVELDFELINGSCRVIVKGNPYWLGLAHRWDNQGIFFVYFDAHNEIFRKLPRFDLYNRRRGFLSIGEFEESLAIIVAKWYEGRAMEISFWAMDDKYDGESSWTKKFTVGPIPAIDRVVGFLKSGEIVAEKSIGKQLFLYDPANNEAKLTQIQMRTLGVHDYVESLV